MATYDFRCQSSQCPREGEPFEARLPMDERDTACVRCPNCNSESRRLVVPLKAPAVVMMKKQETSDRQIPDRLLP